MLERDIQLGEGLLHRLEMLPRIGPKHRPLPQITAPHADLVGRPKRPGQEAERVAALEPLAIGDVTLGSSPDLLDLLRLPEEDLATARLQPLKERAPIDAGGFEGNRRDAAHGEPIGQGFQIGRVRPAAAYGLGIVPRGHGHTMRFRPDVDACCMQVDGGQWRREGRSSLGGFLRAWRHNHLHNSTVRGGAAVGAGAAELQHSSQRDQVQTCHH
jgi:hypothetical protein